MRNILELKTVITEGFSESKEGSITKRDYSIGQVDAKGCLKLIMNLIEQREAKYLSENTNSQTVLLLNFYECKLGDEDLKWLVSSNQCKQNLSKMSKILQTKPFFQRLTELCLHDNRIGKQGWKYFSRGEWLNLKHLSLTHCQISCLSCSFLSKTKWKSLELFKLSSNIIGDRGCLFLTKCFLPKGKHVNLDWNSFGIQGAQALLKWNIGIKCTLKGKNQSVDANEHSLFINHG